MTFQIQEIRLRLVNTEIVGKVENVANVANVAYVADVASSCT